MKHSTLTASFDPNVNPLRPSYYPQVKAQDAEALAQSIAQPTGLSVPGPGLLQGASEATFSRVSREVGPVLIDMGSSEQRPSTSGWCSGEKAQEHAECHAVCSLRPLSQPSTLRDFEPEACGRQRSQACPHQDIQLCPQQISPGQRPCPWTLALGPPKTRPPQSA